MVDNKDIHKQIISVIQKFITGFEKRDTENVDQFIDEFFADTDATIVGTGIDEYCTSLEEIKDYILSAWDYWGTFTLDIDDDTKICSSGNVAWLTTPGRLKATMTADDMYKTGLESSEFHLNNIESDHKERFYEIFINMAHYLYEISRGEQFLWPIRFSAVLIFQKEKWRFQQITLSYPTSRFPDERVFEQ